MVTDRGGWMSSTLVWCVGVMSPQERRLGRSLPSQHRHGGLMHESGARYGEFSRRGCCGALELDETTWRCKPQRSPPDDKARWWRKKIPFKRKWKREGHLLKNGMFEFERMERMFEFDCNLQVINRKQPEKVKRGGSRKRQ
ncbi:hypothetical protein PVAP13_4NG179600 [Panicum virgatum]|uniref:Uncharacterized protein n=1 Tax=Panicum virgatum TaxID=38727 RepID=A0A8T0TDN1_PANVG|nr:hypothetical protein PVAP13_4NG179600 [Panicum virgatum]